MNRRQQRPIWEAHFDHTISALSDWWFMQREYKKPDCLYIERTQ